MNSQFDSTVKSNWATTAIGRPEKAKDRTPCVPYTRMNPGVFASLRTGDEVYFPSGLKRQVTRVDSRVSNVVMLDDRAFGLQDLQDCEVVQK